MLNKLKDFKAVIILALVCILLCILTFLSFINPKLLLFFNIDMQVVLILDVILLTVLLIIIFKKSVQLYSLNKKKEAGSKTSLKYIWMFTMFTFIPSFLIAIFSLFIFNYGLQNFFNSQITKAVNNSYDVAKNYLEESKKKCHI